MFPRAIGMLVAVFSQVSDGRQRRGVRHPLATILTLVFLGLLARSQEMNVLQRWAEENWDLQREPLGFTRDKLPHATTISRALAASSRADFAQTFQAWSQQWLSPCGPLVTAVDGKTSCQGLDETGQPIQTLTAFIHHLKFAAASWSFRGEKTNKPGALLKHLAELVGKFPA